MSGGESELEAGSSRTWMAAGLARVSAAGMKTRRERIIVDKGGFRDYGCNNHKKQVGVYVI